MSELPRFVGARTARHAQATSSPWGWCLCRSGDGRLQGPRDSISSSCRAGNRAVRKTLLRRDEQRQEARSSSHQLFLAIEERLDALFARASSGRLASPRVGPSRVDPGSRLPLGADPGSGQDGPLPAHARPARSSPARAGTARHPQARLSGARTRRATRSRSWRRGGTSHR